MDDDRKKPPRNGGKKPFGKPSGGKPGKSFGGKPGGKKPFVKRGGEWAAGGERPKRVFSGDARPAGDRPFSKGPRPQGKTFGKPFVKRERPAGDDTPKRSFSSDSRPAGDRPFSKGPFPKGSRPVGKPFAKRGEQAAGAEGPKREFRRDDRPAGERPFSKGPRPGGKPFVKSDRPFSKGPRPGGKPFVKRDGEGAADARPKREFHRDDRPSGGGDRPYSKGPRPGGKPFVKRDGERPAGDDRPKRDFVRPTGGDRPHSKGPRPDARPFAERPRDQAASEERPIVPGEKSERPFFKGARPGRNERAGMRGDRPSGERKPFVRATESAGAEEGERIAKRLARAGIASRRDAEALITDGRIRVNGEVLTSPARNVLPTDRIELDHEEIPAIERTRLFLFHKPAGLVTTNRDPEGRKTVFDVLPDDMPRVITIGRLDINTEGLLLLTNDGGLARVLELPATGWLRRYRVRVHGEVDEKALQSLRDGIAVDGVFYGSIEATLDRSQGTNSWLTLGLREGKNREVKNVLGSLGLEVTRLIRISYGPFQLGELAEGAVLEMKGRMLRDQLGERLIEEAGANFEAPVTKPFSNKPVRGERRERDDHGDERKPERPRRELDVSEGGLIKNNWRNRDQIREQALERLQTRPDRKAKGGDFGSVGPDGFQRGRSGAGAPRPGGPRPGGPKTGAPKSDGPRSGPPRSAGPAGKREARERAEHRSDPAKPRTAYVWTAPGARPASRKPSGDAFEGSPRSSHRADPSPRSSRGEGKGEGQRDRFKPGRKPGGPGKGPRKPGGRG